jgi:outer membrane protein OmpA-like peptidoglycan-associated protein
VNSNDLRSPGLLAVLNNAAVGAKAFLPTPLAGILSFGGDVELDLLSGSGSVGFDGSALGLRLAALGQIDLRGLESPIPIRILTNVGYALDNSGKLVESVEKSRGAPIARVERFGLSINRVDHVEMGLGVEGSFSVVRPFVEWNLQVPVNRQSYTCNTRKVYSGDRCLKADESLSAFPSALTLGARVTPWLPGLTGTLAVDVGTTGTSNFIEELAPTLPWDLWFGVGYAFDTVKPPPEKVVVAAPAPTLPPPPKPVLRARGFVHPKDQTDGIAGAIIRYQGRNLTAMASGDDGRFISDALEPGTYTLEVSADGFRPGQCLVIVGGTAVPAPNPPATPSGTSNAPAGTPPESFFDVDCALEALPKVGTITGKLIDADSGAPVGNAQVELTDALRRTLSVTTDAVGAFRFEHVSPGTVSLRAEAPGYLFHQQSLELHAREDARPDLSLHKRPKVSLVELSPTELKIKQQIHFEQDSSTILGDSNALLEQIADTLAHNPGITQVEIQGHTDDTGNPQHNKSLSEARANAVLDWLVAHGIDAGRLVARGYGQEHPLSPNVTPQGRARNRRVQFMISR